MSPGHGGISRFVVALGLNSGLYAHICVRMRLEDYALPMALLWAPWPASPPSRVTYFTRRIVRCGGRQQESEA